MTGVITIARLTYREAVRRRIVMAAFLLGAAFLVLYGAGLYLMVADTRLRGISEHTPPLIRRHILSTLLMMGLYAVNWLMVLMTVLSSVDTLAGEISSGTMQSLATKPVRRWQIVAGKWLGFAVMLTVFLCAMTGGVFLEMRLLAGFTPASYAAVLLMWLESMLLLAVTFRAGASLSTLATGVTVFGLHILAFLGGWIEEFGALAQSQTAVQIGIATSLVMPTEALWRKAAAVVQGPIMGGLGQTPFSSGSVPSSAMIAYAGLYLTLALAFSIRRFAQRDL